MAVASTRVMANSIAGVASRAFAFRQCSGQEQSEVQLTLHQHIFTQMFYADWRGHDLDNLRKTARSPTTVTACQLTQQSVETQSCSKDNEDGLWRADGWQPKSLRNSIWQEKPACWGRPGVQLRLPGLPLPQEDSHLLRSTAHPDLSITKSSAREIL